MFSKKLFTALVSCMSLIAMSAGAQGVLPSRLSFENNQFPMPGHTVTLQYRPAGGPLEGKQDIVGIAYMYNFYKWELGDVELSSLGDSIWTGTFSVPDNCGFVAFRFQSGLGTWNAVSDNNDDLTFGYQLMSEDNEPMPGAYLSWGLFRFPAIGLGVPGYFGYDFKGIHLEAMTMWLQRELDIYNGNGRFMYPAMKAVIRQQYPDQYQGGYAYMNETLLREPELTEHELEMLYNSYSCEVKDSIKADSIHKVLEQKFPKCNTLRWEAFRKIKFSGLNMIRECEDFLAKYPAEDWYQNRDGHDVMYRNLLGEMYKYYKNDAQLDEAFRVASHMSFSMLQDKFYHGPQFMIMKAPVDPKEYIQEAEALIKLMEQAPKDDYMYGNNCSPRQSAHIAEQYLNYNYAVMAMIYERMGRHEDAVKVMQQIPEGQRVASLADGNAAYIRSLKALGRDDEAQHELLDCGRYNVLTPELYKELEAYWATLPEAQQHGSFPLWNESQKLPSVKEEAKQKLRQQLVNDTLTTAFWSEGVNGGKLQSEDLKQDEILVIDFWALWCAPCINALSGMQMAVDYFKGDDQVRFAFVMTQENHPAYQNAIALFERKKLHDMTIYVDHDADGKPGGKELFKQLQPNPSGIPCKVIVKNGVVRYRAEGYGGNPAQLMQEIAYVVEILKEEK